MLDSPSILVDNETKGRMNMVKRTAYRTYIYLMFAFLILLMSWEHNRSMAAVVETDIPEESIRLRILANSDSMEDQALKRRVRDAVVVQMNTWVSGPTTLEEARGIVSSHIPDLEAVVERQIKQDGYDYSYKVELGIVPFPAKMYGNKVYPAGDYEALRITIGEGAGQNWWCVLFPPLCFVDSAKGEAVAQEEQAAPAAGKNAKASEKKEASSAKETKGKVQTASAKVEKGSKSATVTQADDGQTPAKETHKKVRFFFWEKIKSWFA